MSIRNRVVELRKVRAGDLLPDPRNFRRHPKSQRDALRTMLDRVGNADVLITRETPDGLMLVDGHLRAGLEPNAEIPVVVTDLDEEEAGGGPGDPRSTCGDGRDGHGLASSPRRRAGGPG